MEILTIDKPTPANPYTEDVAELIKATDANTDPTKAIAGGIKVPAGDVNKARVKFAQAANAAGKTATLVHKLDELKPDADGNVVIQFTLTAKHKPRRGKSKDEATTEAPAEDAAVPPTEAEQAQIDAADAEISKIEAEAAVATGPVKPRRR